MPTKDQVFAAATELERRGERVTVRAVHAITGGSLRDLTPAVKEWQAEKAAIADAHQQAPEIPNEIRDLLIRAAVEAWSLAHRHAGAEAAELRRQVRDLQQSAEAAAKDGDAVVAELEAELSAARSELTKAAVTIEGLTTSLEAARNAAARAEARADAAMEQVTVAEKRTAEAERRADERIHRLEAAMQLLSKPAANDRKER